MVNKKYKARNGAPFKDSDAQVIGELLENLRDVNGCLTTEEIVKEAFKKNSPIHPYFEWDKSKAASLYNLQQARKLISSVVEVVIIADVKEVKRSFYSVVDEDKGPVYVTMDDALENKSYRQQLLDRCIAVSKNLTTTLQLFQQHI